MTQGHALHVQALFRHRGCHAWWRPGAPVADRSLKALLCVQYAESERIAPKKPWGLSVPPMKWERQTEDLACRRHSVNACRVHADRAAPKPRAPRDCVRHSTVTQPPPSLGLSHTLQEPRLPQASPSFPERSGDPFLPVFLQTPTTLPHTDRHASDPVSAL